jgi:type 1 glutamine amidotransferase
MKSFRLWGAAALVAALALSLGAQNPPQAPKRKKLLAIAQMKGFQHDSTSHGLAVIEQLGYQSGLWDTYIRTDTQLITKKKLTGNAKNLDYFDAILFFTTGELEMDDSQKADLLNFVRQDGKGFIGVHCATDTFYKWPEYGEMIGGYFDGHPWNTFNAPVIVEDPKFPGMQLFPKNFMAYDEIYQPREFSREKVRVLMRLDETQLDLTRKGVKRADKDWAVTWLKEYGKGRVYYSTFGHTNESWDRHDVRQMWLEGIKWAMGMIPGDATPRHRPAN